MENKRYKLFDIEVEGKIHEVFDPIPYANGEGFLRNIVIEMASRVVGVYEPVYMPVTVFGTDATGLDKTTVGRPIRCTCRLCSRNYIGGGAIRWSLAANARAVILGDNKPAEEDDDPTGLKAAANTIPDQDEDLPF